MSHSDNDRAAKNRAQYPLIYAALAQVRSVFGEDAKLLAGVSADGKSVGSELMPGWMAEQRQYFESRKSQVVEVGGSNGEGGVR